MATFTNVATLSYNGTVVNSNVTTGEIQQTLAATKHSLANTYKQGDTLTYIVNIVNTGVTPTVQEQCILWHTAEIYAIISTAHCRQLLP